MKYSFGRKTILALLFLLSFTQYAAAQVARFYTTKHGLKTNNCRITAARWQQVSPVKWQFTITADRFLRNMVRATVGTLLEVGRGRRSPEWVAAVLEARNRSEAGQSVIGEALFLEDIRYPYPLITI